MNLKTRILSLFAALALVAGVTAPATAQNFSSVQVLNGSCSSPAFTFANDGDSGFYLASAGIIVVCINGTEVGRFTSSGISSSGSSAVVTNQTDGTLAATSSTYTGAASRQAVAGDMNLSAGAGTSTALSSAYLAGVMGNAIFDGAMTDTENLVAGVIGKYNVTGANSSTYAKGAVVGEVSGAKASQISSSADGAFVAVIGGDEGPVQARAAYTVDFNNTGNHAVGSSYFNFGLDLQGPGAHSSYMTGRYQDGYVRLGGIYPNAGVLETVTAVCILAGTAAPTNGTSGTGAGSCGAGSLYIRQSASASALFQNTNTTASPTWTEK